MTNEIGMKLDINNYLPTKAATGYISKYKKYRMAGGISAALMHYAGIGMLSGVFISSFVSATQQRNSVKKDCDEIKKLGDEVNNIMLFKSVEMAKRKKEIQDLNRLSNNIVDEIGEVQKKIDEEEERQKSLYLTTQIINCVVVGSFILLIVSKIIVARYNL